MLFDLQPLVDRWAQPTAAPEKKRNVSAGSPRNTSGCSTRATYQYMRLQIHALTWQANPWRSRHRHHGCQSTMTADVIRASQCRLAQCQSAATLGQRLSAISWTREGSRPRKTDAQACQRCPAVNLETQRRSETSHTTMRELRFSCSKVSVCAAISHLERSMIHLH